ncbi:MAG: glycosyltransferase family 2 protein [Culicoidibacterales bacterium]
MTIILRLLIEYTYLFIMFSMWFSVIITLVLMIGAIASYYLETKMEVNLPTNQSTLPTVTILVPAHNEGLVIATTVRRIMHLNYPEAKLHLLVINDNSQDDTGEQLAMVQSEFSQRPFNVLTTTPENGGKGKSHALNLALQQVDTDLIAIYDADAAPEKNALLLLILKYLESDDYIAVYGRNKARNRSRNFLTKCINLELVVSQRILHTGRWFLFQIGQIPGTNFIVERDFLVSIGGWDTAALTEDTDLGFSILQAGKKIALETRSEAYQQEPEDLATYMKQRKRWAKGNFYVVVKNFSHFFSPAYSWRVKLELFFYSATYFWFLLAVIVSDVLFVFGVVALILSPFFPMILSVFNLRIYLNFTFAWLCLALIYALQINLALAFDKGQSTLENFLLSLISYITYSQLFLVISIQALSSFIGDKIFKREFKWEKTKRF